MADFYLGLCYYDIGKKDKAIYHFKKMDSTFMKENYTRPVFRKAYEKMINYYELKKQKNEQLWAVNQLISVDETLNSYFRNLSGRLKKDYDTKLLIRERNNLERTLEAEEKTSSYVIGGLTLLSLISLFVGYKNFKEKRQYRESYEVLIEKQKSTVVEKEIIVNDMQSFKSEERHTEEKIVKTINIAEEVTKEILTKLDKFEKRHQFLERNLTQAKLAKKLKTNKTYLYNVIHFIKNKNFTQYINELRINYLLKLLKEEPKYRHYTISSLAEEVGYNNTKTFGSAFKEVTGMPVSYFLERYVNETEV